MKNRRAAFTFVELIVSMALIFLVLGMSGNLLWNFSRAQLVTNEKYNLNSAMRIASTETNDILRFSSALFTIPEGRFFEANLTDGWNYYGLSPDNTEVIKFTYEERLNGMGIMELRHWRDVVIPARANIQYNMTFVKSTTNDQIVTFRIIATNTLSNTATVAIESEVEVLNALQVVDRGTPLQAAVAIAFRAEERPEDQIVGVITMVMDASGSMAWNLNKSKTSNVPVLEQRITKVKNALNGYTKTSGEVVEGMINEFGKEDNIEIALVPFSTSANSPDTKSSTSNASHQFYRVTNATQRTALKNLVTGMIADGGTNTGDGMRRAYYRNEFFKNNVKTMANYGSKFSTKDYMIILVDGITTMATSVGGVGDSKYKQDDGHVSNFNRPSNWNDAGIIGHGSEERVETDRYVELIGAKIKEAKTKVYVIGFSELSSELASVQKIANAAGATSTSVYKFTDSLDLDAVFTEIKADIMKDLWHVRGPKL